MPMLGYMETRATIVAVTTAAAGACTGGPAVDTIVRDSAGVAIFTNVGDPALLPWTLDTVRVFGGDDTGPATFYQVWQGLVDVDTAGRIFVLDPNEHRVTVFDSTGRHLSLMGRKGEGPGEYEWPISVSATNDGQAYVHDGAGKLVRLAPGEDRGTDSPLAYGISHYKFRHAETTPDGLLIWAHERYSGSDDRLDRLLSVRGTDTTAVISGKPSYRTTAYYPRCSFTFSIHQPLAPQIWWSQWVDRVALSAWGGFRVDVLDEHRLVMSIRWAGVGEKRLSRSEAEALLTSQGVLGACDDDVGEMIERHGFHPQPQIVTGLAVAPDGHVWAQVRTLVGTRILLLARDGSIVGVLPEGFPLPLTFLPDGRPLVQVVDELGVERIGIGVIRG